MRILESLRVIDASQFLSGPIVSLYLAGYGADVIKVERPGGEDARAIGPFRGGQSSYFMSLNRGKRSIMVDLKQPRGVEVFKRLARKADVLVENYLPGVMDRLGVGYETLRTENPKLIYAAISGFGQSGPQASRPAFDSLLQAAGGLISVTGPVGGPPVRVGVSIVDISSGLYLLSGILSALWSRERTGEGVRVDASMLDVTANLMENPVSRHSFTAKIPAPEGLSHPVVSPFSGYATEDGLIFVAVSNDNRFRVLVEALGRPELAEDLRFAGNNDRINNDEALRRILEDILTAKTTGEWEEILIPQGVTVSAINDVTRLKERFPEAFVNVDHPAAGPALLPGTPLRFSNAETDFSSPSPLAGQHTGGILSELGYRSEEIEEMQREGAV
jgi:CoA:oxalate CoA-transferase